MSGAGLEHFFLQETDLFLSLDVFSQKNCVNSLLDTFHSPEKVNLKSKSY